MKSKPLYNIADFAQYTPEELAEAFAFPSEPVTTPEEITAEEEFWAERRKQSENRTDAQKQFDRTCQLKYQSERS